MAARVGDAVRLAANVDAVGGCSVVAVTSAVNPARAAAADLIVIDVGDLDHGLSQIRAAASAGFLVIAVSAVADPLTLLAVLEAGAHQYVSEDDDLTAAVLATTTAAAAA
ncbi:MAG TPA: hypothetical protein VHN98_07815 [Acidimicrobiales bacterium]|nr:hypothetical protein [Acidimicrobiales bacterium]